MAAFLKRILVLTIVFFVMFEVALRVFGLSGMRMDVSDVDGDRLLSPNTEGVWTKGGCKEINSHFKINSQGWNSLRDYEADRSISNDKKIAIIGDSYIQGLHVDVEKSIGAQLEEISAGEYIVQEYGRASGNIHDFLAIYKKFELDKYKAVFIVFHKPDLLPKKPNFMGHIKKPKPDNLFLKIYHASAVLRYLNINQGIGNSFEALYKTKKPRKKQSELNFPNPNLDLSNVCFLYEKDDLNAEELAKLKFNKQEIIHKIIPYDNGFDMHWNETGRLNVANTILSYLNSTNGF